MSNPNTNTNANANSSNNNENNNNSIVNNNDAWSDNLRRNEEQRRKDSQWFNMQPGEKAIVEFLPKFGPVMKDFDGDGIAETLRYEYHVVDMNHKEDGAKPWDLSKTWSEDIDYYLKQGYRTLKVERVGSGMKTKYHFAPVGNAAAATATS
jgi:hypothetical protein